MKYVVPLVLAGLFVGCAPDDIVHTAVAEAPAIYGDDDRQDYYAHPSDELRALTRASIAAMFYRGDLDTSRPNDIRLAGESLQDYYGVCPDERFADQPTGADCSATLIDDDLILTAGHCVESQSDCDGVAYVFNYYMESATSLATVTTDDVYACDELLVQSYGELDYAILRLDRAVVGHSPAPMHPSTDPVDNGDSVTIIGFGSGLPAKIDNGGRVSDDRESSSDFFYASTDSFGGNSGSGVFDADGNVVGILVFGDQDYYDAGGCVRAATFGDAPGGEGITYAFRAVQALCASGYPSERLCSTTGSCGDGFCAEGETNETCSADCTGGTLPAGWRCEQTWYAAGDGCDCDCGAYDPDCDDPSQDLYRCDDGQVCDATGSCVDPDAAPADWVCDPGYYGTLDGCDCECGAYDPDCDVAGQDLLNCADGEVCGADGTCEDPTEPGDDTGVIDEDTGIPDEDTGVIDEDTGVIGDDTGTIDEDTGSVDPDAAVDPDTTSGGGGSESTCSAAPGRAAAWWALIPAWLVVRRRR